MRRRLLQAGALALLIALGAGLTLALLHGPSHGDLGSGPLTIRTQLSPQDPQFGDTVVATIDVSGARDNVRVRSNFAPYAVVSTRRSVRAAGGESFVRIVTRLRCLELSCLPGAAIKTFRLKPVRVSGEAHAWPPLRVHSRITKGDSARPVLRVPPPAAAPARYGVSPTAAGTVLLVLAGLLAAGGVFLLLRVALRKIVPTRRPLPPLERVLAELAASSSNGDFGRRRRALEELARELEPLDEPLSVESRVLAWGPDEPRPEAVSDLATRVRQEVHP
jgi:hypothetical protein